MQTTTRFVPGLCAALVLSVVGSHAQELNPRAYWPARVGTNVLAWGYQYTTGDVVTDPSLPLTGVNSRIHFTQLTYQRFFDLAGRTATVQVNLPYSWGTTEGVVSDEYRRRETAGIGDARVRFAVNLLGAPAMDGAAFRALLAEPKTIVGASLLIQAPTGDYDPDRLINIGTKRWSGKPAIGVIWPFRRTWLLEAEAGVWLFGDNDEFFGQTTREQDPIVSTEVHLVKAASTGWWVALDANYYAGGRTTVDGSLRADLQRNARVGATVAVPYQGRYLFRLAYSAGAVTESGGDFDSASFTFLYAW